MLNSPFKSQVHLQPSSQTQHPRRVTFNAFDRTHRGRADFANARFFGDGTDLIDEGIGISKFFPAGLEDRALRRRLELVLPRLAHRFGPTRWSLGQDRSLLWKNKKVSPRHSLREACFFFFLNPVCSPWEWVAFSRHQHERRQLTHIHTLTHTSTHSEENVPRQWARPLKKLDTAQLLFMPLWFLNLLRAWQQSHVPISDYIQVWFPFLLLLWCNK